MRLPGIEGHRARWAVGRLNPDLSDDTAVAIALVPLHAHILPEDHTRQVLLRSLAEGLGLFRRIYATKANLVLLAIGIEHGYRVAISNADYTAGQGVGVGDADQQHR